MHKLILGITGSGKTTLAKNLAKNSKKQVVVYDPFLEFWSAEVVTNSREKLTSIIEDENTRNITLIIDESSEIVSHYDKQFQWLATQGRHKGFDCIFICQRLKQIAPNVREQCEKLYLFVCSKKDAYELSLEFNQERLLQANILKRFDFFECSRWSECIRKRIYAKNIPKTFDREVN